MLLKVSARSSPNSVAGAIAGVIREQGSVQVQVIGAGALNQAIKAVAVARSFLEPEGVDIVCVPMFQDIDIDGEARTAIRLIVEERHGATGTRAAAIPREATPHHEPAPVPAEQPL